jgi:hypothetical protein
VHLHLGTWTTVCTPVCTKILCLACIHVTHIKITHHVANIHDYEQVPLYKCVCACIKHAPNYTSNRVHTHECSKQCRLSRYMHINNISTYNIHTYIVHNQQCIYMYGTYIYTYVYVNIYTCVYIYKCILYVIHICYLHICSHT